MIKVEVFGQTPAMVAAAEHLDQVDGVTAETSMTVRGFPPDCSKATVSLAVLSPSDHKPRLVTIPSG